MKVLIEIGHPAHVHFFRNAIEIWKRQGHDMMVVSRDKDITSYLLMAYGIDAVCLSKAGRGVIGLFTEMLLRDYRIWTLSRRFSPDIMTSIGGTWISQIARLIKTPAVVFYDTENATVSNAMTYPLLSALCTPKCYQKATRLGSRHLRYPGYHELAYLHPCRFTPDEKVIARFGIKKSDRYFVVRFIAWEAGHDVGEKGIPSKSKKDLVHFLAQYGRVFITSEGDLPQELMRFALQIPPEHMHHLMAFSTMVVGESATMASEAAVLGVPAIFISDASRGYIDEQEQHYGLVFHFMSTQIGRALEKISDLIHNIHLDDEWQKKRKMMLNDTIDVTAFVVDFINSYPDSLARYRQLWHSIQDPDVILKDLKRA